MALIYGPNTKILFSGAILRALGGTGTYNSYPPYTLGASIYAGTAPLASDITASWVTYNSTTANYLAYFNNVVWNQTNQLLQMTTAPTAVNVLNTGTASWAIIWGGQPTIAQLSSTTLPLANFLVVSVSDATGDGVIRFTTTAFTAGASKAMLDASMSTNI